MKRTLLTTGDGSATLHIPEWNEQYHSKHGAVAEALHVFIKEGLHHWMSNHNSDTIRILEMGFGTGLNVVLTYAEAEANAWKIDITTVEAYPLSLEEIEPLKYHDLVSLPKETFLELHKSDWEVKHSLSELFQLTKMQLFFSELDIESEFDLVYFDAFGIRVQPDLWTEEIFGKMYRALVPGGILVTYAANGNARRALQAVGFEVERIPGPPGKREMMRATKH